MCKIVLSLCQTRRRPRPGFSLTRSVKGKTVTRIIPKAAVEKTKARIAEYHRFQETIGDLVETNIKICDHTLELEKQAGFEEAEKRG